MIVIALVCAIKPTHKVIFKFLFKLSFLCKEGTSLLSVVNVKYSLLLFLPGCKMSVLMAIIVCFLHQSKIISSDLEKLKEDFMDIRSILRSDNYPSYYF